MSTEQIRALREQGQHEEARLLALELVAAGPADPDLLYEAARVHDFLGFESAAIPFYVQAIASGLSGEALRGAYLGLGSTYRALGRYDDALATFDAGRAAFPDAAELTVFRAMTLYNLGRAKEALADVLRVLAASPGDDGVAKYARAIAFYADDLDRTF